MKVKRVNLSVLNKIRVDKKWIPALKGIFSDTLVTGITSIVNLIALPLYIALIGASEYGLWLTILGLVSVLTLIEIGVDQYLISELSATEKGLCVKKLVVNEAVFIKVYTSLVYCFVGYFICKYSHLLLPPGALLVEYSQITVIVTVSYFVANNFLNLFSSILFSQKRFEVINYINGLISVLNVVLTLVGLKMGVGIAAFPLSMLVTALMQTYFYYRIYGEKFDLRLRDFFIKKNINISLYKYSISFQALKLVHYYRNQFIYLIIGNVAGAQAVTAFSVVIRLPQMASTIISKIVSPIFPILNQDLSLGNISEVQKIFIRLSREFFRFAFLSAIVLYLVNPIFIKLWVGPEYLKDTDYMLVYLIYFVIIQGMSGFGIVIYSTQNFEKWPQIAILELLISIPVVWYFGSKYSTYGIILSFLLCSLISQIYLGRIVLKQLRIHTRAFFKTVFFYSIIPNIAAMIAIFAMNIFYEDNILYQISKLAIAIIINYYICKKLKTFYEN